MGSEMCIRDSGRSVWNDVTNVFAKFRNFPLRINKALGIFRKQVTTRTRTTVVAIRDPFRVQKSKTVDLSEMMSRMYMGSFVTFRCVLAKP